MIITLTIIGMLLLIFATNLVRNANYLGCVLYIVAALIFAVTGIYYIRHDETLIGILQFVATVGALISALYGIYFLDDFYD